MPFQKGHTLWKKSLETKKKQNPESFLPKPAKQNLPRVYKNKERIFRPRKYADPAKLFERAQEYFDHQEEIKRPITISGLCNFLKLSTKSFLDDYAKRPEYEEGVTLIVQRVEQYSEESLFILKNTQGAAMALANRFKWANGRDPAPSEGARIVINIAPELHKKYAKAIANPDSNIQVIDAVEEIKNLPPQN